MRGVTDMALNYSINGFISTRTPHAGSDDSPLQSVAVAQISTRTPHAGSDQDELVVERVGIISTRTPHAGSDVLASTRTLPRSYFNPHSPCGE